MKNIRKLKGLKSQLKIMQGDFEALEVEFKNKQREYSQKRKSIINIKESISLIEDDKVLKVSEHAVLRYCERIMRLDTDQVEKEILSNEIKLLVQTLGGTGTYNSNGFKVVIKDYTVTTIV